MTPVEWTIPVSPFHVAMKGTTGDNPRCIALEGEVGREVGCAIYAKRPSTCRNFTASYAQGKKSSRCDEARDAFGLPPLVPPASRERQERGSEPRDPGVGFSVPG